MTVESTNGRLGSGRRNPLPQIIPPTPFLLTRTQIRQKFNKLVKRPSNLYHRILDESFIKPKALEVTVYGSRCD